jgi:hypothetical protein
MDIHGLYRTADGSALRFYEEPKQNNAASEKHGRPIFDQCLMVEVITPGQRESCPVFELERIFAEEVGIDTPRRSHKYREYEAQIKAYREGSDDKDMRGTPIDQWPALNVAQAAACKHAGIFTVEALAALPDSRYPALGPGARSLVERAKAYIDKANNNAATEALAAENAQLRDDMKRLQETVAQLSAAAPKVAKDAKAEQQLPPPVPQEAPAAVPPPAPADLPII